MKRDLLLSPELDERIDRQAERHLAEIREACQRARLELGLPLMLYLEHRHHVDLPPRFFSCPECGGRLYAEIEEWESADGEPVGVMVFCVDEWDELDLPRWRWQHRHWFSDWHPVQRRVERYVRRRVRII